MGLGGRARGDYLPAIEEMDQVDLVATVDVNPNAKAQSPGNAAFFTNIEEALDYVNPDIALVVTPHSTHASLCHRLLESNVAVLKEKPFATSVSEAHTLSSRVLETNGFVQVAVQRQQSHIFSQARNLIPRLGRLRHFRGVYQLNTPPYGETWRARSEEAGGGALIDMGYHTLDYLVSCFGLPEQVRAEFISGRDMTSSLNVEESMRVSLKYASGLTGDIFVSRCEPRKIESYNFVGENGMITVGPGECSLWDANGRESANYKVAPSWPEGSRVIIESFIENIGNPAVRDEELERGIQVMTLIESIYSAAVAGTSVTLPDLGDVGRIKIGALL